MKLSLIHPSTLLLSLALACGGGDGKTGGSSEGSDASTSAATGGATDSGTSDTSTSDTPTVGSASDAGTSGGPTSEATSSTSGVATDSGTGDSGTGAGESSTGGGQSGFERFTLTRSAGPCAPNADCDGFIELLGTRLLRVEPFGAVGDPVTEVEISEEDFAAAVQVFAAAELVALLDAPDPLCDPPTDIFESMFVQIDGAMHDADTTTCEQPPLVAARDAAQSLAMKYAP